MPPRLFGRGSRLVGGGAVVAVVFAASLAAVVEPACESTSSTAGTAPLDCSSDGGEWPLYGANICNTRAASGGGAITPQTVGRLAKKWEFNAAGDISATPAVVGGQVYVPDWGGMMNRIDAVTGMRVWSRSIADILGLVQDSGSDAAPDAEGDSDEGSAIDASSMTSTGDAGAGTSAAAADATAGPSDAAIDAVGDADGEAAATALNAGTDAAVTGVLTSPVVVARGTPIVNGGLVIFGVGTSPAMAPPALMIAIEQSTASLVWRTQLDTHPAAIITSSPVLDDGRIYVGVSSSEEGSSLINSAYKCCSFRGSVAALDAATGKILWQTPMIDDATYRNADGTLSGYAGAAVWSGTPTIDRNRRLLYVTTGNNYSAPPGQADSGLPPPDGDHIESIVALDLDTGAIRWSARMTSGDVWSFAHLDGNDYDFGCGANLYQATIGGTLHDVIGAGQKSGVYWALDADTHAVLWKTQVGPGGHFGGIHWGTAVDDQRVYVGVNDEMGTNYKLGGKGDQAGQPTGVGSWAALDRSTGETIWQIANPAMTAPLGGASVNGPVTVVNGVVFVGSMDADGMMYAIDAASGKILWPYKSMGTVYGGPAIADGVVYWGNGYPSSRLLFGTPGHTLYAFALPN
jgi:polyvinyl alcohol dehydrogenase (cytochrome)